MTSCNLRKCASIKSPHAGSLQAVVGGQEVHWLKQSTSQTGAVLQILWPSYASTPLHLSDSFSFDYYCVAFILLYYYVLSYRAVYKAGLSLSDCHGSRLLKPRVHSNDGL